LQNIEAAGMARGVRHDSARVIIKAIAKQLSWVQAATILGVTLRHMRRIRWGVVEH
jgi:hypothetical protein